MSKASIGDDLWAEMTEGRKIDAVFKGHATLKQMSEGLLDGSEELRQACRDSLAHTGPAFENLPLEAERLVQEDHSAETPNAAQAKPTRARRTTKARNRSSFQSGKHGFRPQRFGLPSGFVPRLQRTGRTVLLELNVYRLPSGQEFIPSLPSGTLGTRQHVYALLTSEQYLGGKRGSVYVRSDGRIFDYSVVSSNLLGDFFDTGYTIYDLERTGRYAPAPRKKRKRRQPPRPQARPRQQAKHRRAAVAG
jgi:hypothetical protein